MNLLNFMAHINQEC